MKGNKIVRISKTTFVDGYKIKIEFDDKATQVVDFERFIFSSRNPMIKIFRNIVFFLFPGFE